MKEIIGIRLIKRLKKNAVPSEKSYDIRDTRLKGFILRVQPSGYMSFYCEYGRGKKYFIGRADTISPEDAREIALQKLADASSGVDPNVVKQTREVFTLKVFLSKEYGPWVLMHRKTGANMLSRLETCFLEVFGSKNLDDINLWIVQKWQTSRLKSGVKASTVNREVAALKAALSKAVEWELIKDHPLSKLKMLKVDAAPKVRYLSPEEAVRLRTSLDLREKLAKERRETANLWRRQRGYSEFPIFKSSMFTDYIKPMVLISINTGVRRGELFQLHWENVDIEKATLTIEGVSSKKWKNSVVSG